MKFYDKNKKQFVEFGDSFIEQYAKAYYYPENGKIDQPLIKRLSRCSQYSEREIDSLIRKWHKKRGRCNPYSCLENWKNRP